jgi:enoyl-CoA hydratase/carnithine racemase
VDSAVAVARRALTELPCPSVLLCADSGPGTAEIPGLFDVVVSTDFELDAVVSGIRRSPLASSALVQLLRLGEERSLHEALIAESFAYSTLQSGPEFKAWLAAHRARVRAAGTIAAADNPAVRVERDGVRLNVTLDRPERRNAFSVEMRDALVDALALAVSDESLTEIVLRGAGDAFSAGGDLDEFGDFADPATAHAIRSMRNAGRLLARCGKRVRAEVHGACVGAGVELPAFAGRVCASRDAFFELPEISMGLVPGAGGTASIPRRIGRQRTAHFALSGVRLDAAKALEWGLVDEVR